MKLDMWKKLLPLVVVLLTGCVTRLNEIEEVAHQSVAIFVGHKLTAKESLHPSVRLAADIALFTALPVTVFAPPVLHNYGREGGLLLADEVNKAIAEQARCILASKGYKPSLHTMSPLDFELRRGPVVPEDYEAHAQSYYGLNDELHASLAADVILFMEYSMTVYEREVDEGQAQDLDDLFVDFAHAHLYAVTPPPENKVVFVEHINLEGVFQRMPVREAVARIVQLYDWPDKPRPQVSPEETCQYFRAAT